jgi:hypothetical protein
VTVSYKYHCTRVRVEVDFFLTVKHVSKRMSVLTPAPVHEDVTVTYLFVRSTILCRAELSLFLTGFMILYTNIHQNMTLVFSIVIFNKYLSTALFLVLGIISLKCLI